MAMQTRLNVTTKIFLTIAILFKYPAKVCIRNNRKAIFRRYCLICAYKRFRSYKMTRAQNRNLLIQDIGKWQIRQRFIYAKHMQTDSKLAFETCLRNLSPKIFPKAIASFFSIREQRRDLIQRGRKRRPFSGRNLKSAKREK